MFSCHREGFLVLIEITVGIVIHGNNRNCILSYLITYDRDTTKMLDGNLEVARNSEDKELDLT